MNAMTKALLTVALLASAACDGAPTASSAFASTDGPAFAGGTSSSLSFSSTQSGSESTPQTSTGGVGRIDFTGSMLTSTPCYTVSATHTAKSSAVTVTVSAAESGGFCTQVMTNNNYQGAVTGLAAGTYAFTVQHSDGGSRTTAHSSTVVVQ